MLKRLITITFSFLFYFDSAISMDLKVVYLDVDKIINQSSVGKDLTKQLKVLNDNNIKRFKESEKKLADIKVSIVKQKNILSEEEFSIKANTLKKDVNDYKKNIDIARKNIDKKRLEATNKILKILNKILSEYSSKNSISLILQKKDIVIGMTELDITNQILELVNIEVKTVKLN
jgi:outer membrane protein